MRGFSTSIRAGLYACVRRQHKNGGASLMPGFTLSAGLAPRFTARPATSARRANARLLCSVMHRRRAAAGRDSTGDSEFAF